MRQKKEAGPLHRGLADRAPAWYNRDGIMGMGGSQGKGMREGRRIRPVHGGGRLIQEIRRDLHPVRMLRSETVTVRLLGRDFPEEGSALGEKDILEKTLEAYNDVFADIVNGLLFKGEPIVLPDALVDAQARSFYAMEDEAHSQERDVAKYWNRGTRVRIAVLGLENQTEVDRDMPFRVIEYDGAHLPIGAHRRAGPLSRHHAGAVFWPEALEEPQPVPGHGGAGDPEAVRIGL